MASIRAIGRTEVDRLIASAQKDREVAPEAYQEVALRGWYSLVVIARYRCHYDSDGRGCIQIGCATCEARRAIERVEAILNA